MSTENNIEKNLKQAIQLHEKQQMKGQLQQLEQKRKTRKLAFTWLSVAAAVTTLIALTGIFLLNSPKEGTALYASNFKPYPNALEPVTRSLEPTDFRMQTFEAYEAGEYAKAAEGFQQLLTIGEDADIRFYLAMSLQNNGQFDSALSELQRLEGASSQFASQALWYRALLEIRADQRDAAAKTLQNLLQAKPAYKVPEARALLEEL